MTRQVFRKEVENVLSNEDRERLVRTAVWTGIGTGVGVSIAHGLIEFALTLWEIARQAPDALGI